MRPLAPTNPMLGVLAAMMAFLAITDGLAIPAMIQVTGLSVWTSVGAGLAAMLVAFAAAGVVRRPWGWVLVVVALVAALALGFLTDMMFVMAGIFTLLVVIVFILGHRLESR